MDEAYFEYSGETAAGDLEDDVVVIRTFSKIFGLAGARVGYALAAKAIAAELNARQAPAPLSTLSAELALAALAAPPDPAPVLAERERLAERLRSLGLAPLPSHANFLYVPVEDGLALAEKLAAGGLIVRAFADAVRITVLDREDDDLLLEALARALEAPSHAPAPPKQIVRRLRATAEARVAVRLVLDGDGRVRADTGIPRCDRLLERFARAGGFDLVVEAVGEPGHEEQTATAIGTTLGEALAETGAPPAPFGDETAVGGLEGTMLRALAQAAGLALEVEAI